MENPPSHVAYETMHRLDRSNTERLHGAIGHTPPAEAERRRPAPPGTIGMVA